MPASKADLKDSGIVLRTKKLKTFGKPPLLFLLREGTKKSLPAKAKPTVAKKGAKGDTVDVILTKMAEMKAVGVDEVKGEELLRATGYKAHDSKGFRNATKKLIKELGYVVKENKTSYKLTEAGYQHLVGNGRIEIPPEPTSNEELHDQLKQMLAKVVKAPSQKLEAVWDKLMDGKAHPVDVLVKVAGYERSDSKGYRQIIKGMNDLALLEKSGKSIRFSDKVFKFGRP